MRSTGEEERQAMRVVGQIHIGPHPIPMDVFAPEAAATERRVGLTKNDHTLEKTDHVLIALDEIPIQPSGLIVLIVGIVVPTTSWPRLNASCTMAEPINPVAPITAIFRVPLLIHSDRFHTNEISGFRTPSSFVSIRCSALST